MAARCEPSTIWVPAPPLRPHVVVLLLLQLVDTGQRGGDIVSRQQISRRLQSRAEFGILTGYAVHAPGKLTDAGCRAPGQYDHDNADPPHALFILGARDVVSEGK